MPLKSKPIYIIQIDTTTATAYMCVAVDTVTPAYTWKQITA